MAAQDGTQVSAEAIQRYLQQAGLADYTGSAFRGQARPIPEPAAGVHTRYAAQLLPVPALQALGLERVLPLLDVTPPTAYYSHHLHCYTLLFALAAGQARVSQVGELVEDEFAAVVGNDRYPQRSDLHAYLDRLEEVVTQVEQATGQPVELVGGDRGALSQAVLKAFDRRGTGLVVWVADTPAVRQVVAETPQSAFVDGEYAAVRRPAGQVVRRLKTRLADLPAPVINARGYHCRTIVMEAF